jgi:hypothetical protein
LSMPPSSFTSTIANSSLGLPASALFAFSPLYPVLHLAGNMIP